MEPLAPFSLELVFTGLCAFSFDQQGASALLVNASDPKAFKDDPDFSGLDREIPYPHFPSFSYLMSQQIRDGVLEREPDSVFAGPMGEEVGVCDLTGEDLTLDVASAQTFQSGSLGDAPTLSSLLNVPLSPLCSSPLPNSAVITRFRLTHGTLETLRVAPAGEKPLLVDFQTLRLKGQKLERPPQPIADQLVLRIDNLTEPVAIRSSSKNTILLRPDYDTSGRSSRTVIATLANYHRNFRPPVDASYDFLWFYELLDFTVVPQPSRLDRKIPISRNGPGPFTGTSSVCPPIKI